MIPLLLPLPAVAACPETTVADLVAEVPAPAIVVLGERHGERKELRRAAEVVEALAARGPVTVALEAIHADHQDAATALTEHGKKGRFKRDSEWKRSWGFPLGAYWPVIRQATDGVVLVGAGLDLGPAPAEREIRIPDGYEAALLEAMEGHEMSDEVRARFARSMAWRDLRIAELAVDGWSGEGTLVILTGRGHVEGGRGVTFQLEALSDAPVRAALLDGEDAECPAGIPAIR